VYSLVTRNCGLRIDCNHFRILDTLVRSKQFINHDGNVPFRLDAELRYSSSEQSDVACVGDLDLDFSMDTVMSGIMQATSPPTTDDELELPDWEGDMMRWIMGESTICPEFGETNTSPSPVSKVQQFLLAETFVPETSLGDTTRVATSLSVKKFNYTDEITLASPEPCKSSNNQS
jgi:hypothetical protein